MSSSTMGDIEHRLAQDLLSPSKSRRLAAVQAPSLFSSIKNNDDATALRELLLQIENVPPTITEFRERQRHLENLLHLLHRDSLAKSKPAHLLAAQHLIGSLYINFSPFWGSTVRAIVDIIKTSSHERDLIEAVVGHLRYTNKIIYNAIDTQGLWSDEDRPDHVLHRNFLFQVLHAFTHVIDTDNVIFMDEFFIFVEKELLVSPFIEKFSRTDLIKKPEVDPTDECCKGDKSVMQKRKSRETFITVAKIIQTFKNPLNVHRNTELKSLLLELLCCRDSSVQRAAFSCWLVFERSHLEPFTERIFKLISDKMARSCLSSFSVNEESSNQLISNEQRSHLMPILLRILFGKMIGKIGRKTAGKDKADVRKAMIMRYIAECQTSEIMYFFSILFEPFFAHMTTPYSRLAEELNQAIDYGHYVPMNKIHAMVSSLSAYINSVAHLNVDALPSVLKLINVIVFHVMRPLAIPELVAMMNSSNLEMLKNLRRSCINLVTEFFQTFGYYKFRRDEINHMFHHQVWPSTQGFIDRNYAYPTPFLKFIEALASVRVFHPLLVKRNKSNPKEYLLRHVINLYADAKTERRILKLVAKILADIVEPDHDTEMASGDQAIEEKDRYLSEMLLDEDAVTPAYDKASYKLDESLTYSQEILLGSIPIIFERLRKNCQDFIDKNDPEYRIDHHELLVMSSLSRFIKDPEQSVLSARVLIMTLGQQKKEELILQTIRTAEQLLEQADDRVDTTIIDILSEILSYQPNIEQRKGICSLLRTIAKSSPELVQTSHVLSLMNSTCDDLVEVPDLVKWNEGFRGAFEFIDAIDAERINNSTQIRHAIVLLVNQTSYIMNRVDKYEFSVRENCKIFHEKLASKLALLDETANRDFLSFIISETLLERMIKRGLRETNETVKHSFISALRSLALECHDKNSTLRDFYHFCDANDDLDFWVGISHIQLHNRSKALARLIANDKLNEVSPKNLSGYFMPLGANFLFSKNYKAVGNLIENSIKLIGLIARRLNWVTYESTLNYYLGLLTKANATYQKTNIKLITEILRNFNFDLTNCSEAMSSKEENDKLAERMKKRRGQRQEPRAEVVSASAPTGKKLNPSTATKVYISVYKHLLPKLNASLHQMTHVEFEHDKNMANYMPEKEEIKKIPLAYAIVQLLNLLPCRYVLFRDHLPSIFLKLASFLKSKNEQVRKSARMTLTKVMTFVGPAYLPDLLRCLAQNLSKGFQIHVLNYTVHSVLTKLQLDHGDLDNSIQELVNSSMQEIFGKLAEDKEIAQILSKTYEAKKTTSYDTLQIIATYISAEKLPYLMNSVKNLLRTTTEPKTVNKLSVCIQKIFTGLSKNTGFPLLKLVNFIRSEIEESIPSLKIRQKIEHPVKFDQGTSFGKREDRYLIKKDLPRDRIKSKIHERGNFHMLVENSLRLLLHMFEERKAKIRQDTELAEELDSFTGLLSKCLKSSSTKCVTKSLKCIHFIASTRTELTQFKSKCDSIVKKIFVLLSLYNGVGMVKGDNFDMVCMCFKTLTLILVKCKQVKLSDDQLKAMLSYIEQDLHDASRQATAFSTLLALLKRRLDSPELPEIMAKVAHLLVTSDDDKVRSICIKLWREYLLEYSHEAPKLQGHLQSFLRQLDYEFVNGRVSILKILDIVIAEFPEQLLLDHSLLLFSLLAQRVVNEDCAEAHQLVMKDIGLLIQRLPDQRKYFLQNFVMPWAGNKDNLQLKLLGVRLINFFLNSPKGQSKRDLKFIRKVLSVLEDPLQPDESSCVKSDEDVIADESEHGDQLAEDATPLKLVGTKEVLVMDSLDLFEKLIDGNFISCAEQPLIENLKKIWLGLMSDKVIHWHSPIALKSWRLCLRFIREVDLAHALNAQNGDDYLTKNSKQIVRTLFDNAIVMLDRAKDSNPLIALLTECILLLSQLVANSKATINFERKYIGAFAGANINSHILGLDDLPSDGFVEQNLPYKINESKRKLDLRWISVKMLMQARKEAAVFRLSEYHRRNLVISWSAAMSQQLGKDRLYPYLLLFMMTPIRELTDKGRAKADANQRQTLLLGEDLLKFVKSIVGVEIFQQYYTKIQLYFTRKRIHRKRDEAISKVRDQVRGVKRKIQKQKDKDVKRRKAYKSMPLDVLTNQRIKAKRMKV